MRYQKIFFSYSRVDGEKAALKLAGDLRKLGANVWMDQLDIKSGELGTEESKNALETSDCVLFIVTPKSTSSNNVLSEPYYSLEIDKDVIPVIFETCDLPFRLKNLQQIDFTVGYDQGLDRLLQALDLNRDSIRAEENSSLVKESQVKSTGTTNWSDENYGKQLREELLWNRLSTLNTASAYNEYLATYPQGKFREKAIRKIDELNQIEKEANPGIKSKRKEYTATKKRQETDGEQKITKPKNGKVIGIGIAALLLVGVAIFFIVTGRFQPGKYESSYSLLNTGDTVKNANQSSSVSPQQETLPVNGESNSETTSSDPVSDNSGSQTDKASQPSQIEGSTSSTLDFDETINERILGSWYEADNTPVNGLTSLMAQTYYRNGAFEAVSTFKNESGAIVLILTYSGNWRVKDGYIYEEVTASSDPKSLEVGYNQTTQITSITNQIIDYIDTKGIPRKMYRLQP